MWKWEDKLFARVFALIGLVVALFIGVLFIAKAPGPMKVAGLALVFGAVYGWIKVIRLIRLTIRTNKKQKK